MGDPGLPATRAIPPRTEALGLLAILAYAALLWVWGVGRLDFHSSMEGSRALVSQQMIRTGDYLIPQRGAVLYLAKPPLFYWGVVLASKAFGAVTETAVRLVCAASAAAVLLALYLGARRVFGPTVAFLAAAIGATMPLVFDGATDGNVDMTLALGVAIALLGAFFMLEGGRRARASAVACGVGLAIGLMTKGPIVLVFFVPTLVLYAGFRREGPLSRSWRSFAPYLGVAAVAIGLVPLLAPAVGRLSALLYLLPAAMLVRFVRQGRSPGPSGRAWLVVVSTTLALVLPWVLLAVQRLGLSQLVEILGREIWHDRITDVGSSNRGPPWLYATEFPLWTLPHVLLLPVAFLPSYGAGTDGARGRMLLFARCWLLGSLVLFTVVGESRRLRYVLPAFPAAALLAAHVTASALAGRLAGRVAAYVTHVGRGTAVVLCAAPGVLLGLWFHAGLGLTGTAVAVGVVAAAGAAAGLALVCAGRIAWAPLAAFALVLFAAKVYVHFGKSDVDNARRSPRPACASVRAEVPPGEDLWLAGLPSASVAFYLDALPLEFLLADASRLGGLEHVYVCVSGEDRAGFVPPEGFWASRSWETPSPDGTLVLLRLDREPPRGPR